MRMQTCVLSSLLLVAGAVGCTGPEGGPGDSPSGAAPAPVLQIDTKKLPKLAEPMGPLDEGRLEVAPPADWHVPPRRARWLARFQADPGSPYPMIFVTADDSDATFHVTRENLDQFAAQVRKELLADSDTQRLAAGVQPVIVGNFRGTLYRRWGKSGSRVMERWMLETVANGRRYTLELRSREGLADEYLPHLYAVASAMKLSQGKDGSSALTVVDEDPDAETPGAEPVENGDTADGETNDGETNDDNAAAADDEAEDNDS